MLAGTSLFSKVSLLIDPFHATDLFLYSLKPLQNQRFSDVSRVYRKRSVAWNGLNLWQCQRSNENKNSLVTISFTETNNPKQSKNLGKKCNEKSRIYFYYLFLANAPILYLLETMETFGFLLFSGAIKKEHWPELTPSSNGVLKPYVLEISQFLRDFNNSGSHLQSTQIGNSKWKWPLLEFDI